MDQLLPSTYHHIFKHANGNEDLFWEPENYRYFLQQYYKPINTINNTYGHCLIKAAVAVTTHLPGFKNLEGVATSNLTRYGLQ